MTKKNLIILIVCALAFIGLLLIATFFDLQINIALGDGDSVYGQFFAYLGDSIAWIIIPVAFVILYQATLKTNKYYKWLKIAYLVLSFVGFFFLMKYLFGKFAIDGIKWKYLYICLFSILSTWLSILGTNKIDKGSMQKLIIFAVFMLIVVAVSQGVVTLLKAVWARQRFRNMEGGNIAGGDVSAFTPWYKPTLGKHDESLFVPDTYGQEDEDAYKSFPSGHTASAACSFVIIMLPELFEKLKKYKIWFYVGPAIFTVLVAISRIVNRAHYLSDVLFGGTITIVTVFLAKYLTYMVKEKINNKINGGIQEIVKEE